MTLRSVFVAGCLGLAGTAWGQETQGPVPTEPRKLQLDLAQPMSVASSNQQMADTIAAVLGKNAQLRRYRIDVVFAGGVAELQGQVADETQRDLVRNTVMSIPGVAQIRDHLQQVSNSQAVAVQQPEGGLLERKGETQIPVAPNKVLSPTFPPAPSKIPALESPQVSPLPGASALPPEPTPIFQAQPGMLPNPQYQQPPLPPYAWPTYAPYNNYSRVAYPTLHNYNQWPFIGPMYPYPKIPLGWRRVTLEWQDGSWWYGRESNSHDWWRIRYW